MDAITKVVYRPGLTDKGIPKEFVGSDIEVTIVKTLWKSGRTRVVDTQGRPHVVPSNRLFTVVKKVADA